jgi:hypothetical protein
MFKGVHNPVNCMTKLVVGIEFRTLANVPTWSCLRCSIYALYSLRSMRW